MSLIELEMVSGYSKYPRDALLKVSSRSNIRKPRLHLSSKSLPGVLEDLEGPDGAGDGVGGSSIPIGSFTQSLMMI